MAKIGETEVASRYDGVAVGPRLAYSFETQANIPIDQSSALARSISPFTLRLLPPDALLLASQEQTETSVDLITAAATAADNSDSATAVRNALARVSPIDTEAETLASFVSSGQFFADSGASIYPTIADALQAADIALQLQYILDAPPLTLLVNPGSMSISYTTIQSYVTRTRYGFVFERWGEEQPTISFSGTTGAFMAGIAQAPGTDPFAEQVRGQTSSPSRMQFASKRDSAAWQNLTALFHFYRSNGYIYDTVQGTEAHQFVGAVAIDYDQWTYVGHINSFEYGYEDGKPHQVTWTMEFQVDRAYDTASSPMVVQPLTSPTLSPSNPPTASSATVTTASDVVSNTESTQSSSTDLGQTPFGLLE